MRTQLHDEELLPDAADYVGFANTFDLDVSMKKEKVMRVNDVSNERPAVRLICYNDSHGNPSVFTVGVAGITEIREIGEDGEYAMIPWVEVWAGDKLLARFSQHKLEHIFY